MPLKVVFAVLTVVFLWGSSFPVAKYALYELSPLNLAILRLTLASLVFAVLALRVEEVRGVDRRDLPWFLLLGFLGVTWHFSIQYWAVSLTTAANAGLLIGTSPIWVALLSLRFFRERLSWQKVVGLITAVAGVFLVVSRGGTEIALRSDYLKGDLLMLLNAATWALASILGKRMSVRYKPFVTTFYTTLAGTLLFWLMAPFTGLVRELQAGIAWSGWLAVIYLGVFCSVVGYSLWYYSLSQVEATKVATFQYLQPLFTFIVAVLLLGEVITLPTVLGTLLIIAGVATVARA